MALKAAFRKYLGVLAPHDDFAALIRKKGKWFIGRASSQDCELTKLWAKVNRPKAKGCWYNSQQFCIDCGDHRYFEGYVQIPGGLPIEHAWVVMDEKVIDFTLEAMERKAKRERKVQVDTSSALYLGVEVPWMFACSQGTKNAYVESVAELYFASVKNK